MHLDEPHARIGHRGTVASRAKLLASKALVVIGGAFMLVSAVAVSMVFLAIGLAVVLTFGGYLWWQTRDLRRQMRARMESPSRTGGQIIEGEVISRGPTRR